jgi:hypothetical protein
MKLKKSLLALAASAAIVPSVFAGTFVGGELGYVDEPVRGKTARAEVRAEYERFRQHPVLSDGTVFLQGDAGYVSASQGQSADRHPHGTNTHSMGNTAGPSAKGTPSSWTEAQRRAYREQYVN